jgi:hypothetical protein
VVQYSDRNSNTISAWGYQYNLLQYIILCLLGGRGVVAVAVGVGGGDCGIAERSTFSFTSLRFISFFFSSSIVSPTGAVGFAFCNFVEVVGVLTGGDGGGGGGPPSAGISICGIGFFGSVTCGTVAGDDGVCFACGSTERN